MSKVLIYAMTPNRTSKDLTVAEYATAGFLSAIPSTLVTAPVERAKVLLQVSSARVFEGVISYLRSCLYRCKVRVRAVRSTRVSSM